MHCWTISWGFLSNFMLVPTDPINCCLVFSVEKRDLYIVKSFIFILFFFGMHLRKGRQQQACEITKGIWNNWQFSKCLLLSFLLHSISYLWQMEWMGILFLLLSCCWVCFEHFFTVFTVCCFGVSVLWLFTSAFLRIFCLFL